MKKLNLYILIFILILSSQRIFSQTAEVQSGGSPYTIFGIGDLSYYTSTRTYSMGITGISLFGNYVNNLNPATLTKMKSTLISVDGNYGFLKSQNTSSENKLSSGNVLGINIGIPFDQYRGWTMSLGFNPVSLVNYKVRVIGNTGAPLNQSYSQTYSGKGGLSRISTGMSYNLLQKISIGLEYNYSFGEIRQQNYINFLNQGYTNSNIQQQFDFSRSFIKGGAIFEVGKIFKSYAMKDFSLGVVFQSGFKMNTTEEGIIGSSLGSDSVTLNQGVIDVPDTYGFGLTNIFHNKYLVSGDVLMQDWTKYTEFGVSNPNFEKSIRAGLGFEILPTRNKHGFWQLLTYRIGGFYQNEYYKVEGQDIHTYGVRAGLNIPITDYNSIDLGINYSIRGKTSDRLIKDEYFNITAGINFGELWFIRPKEEDQ